MSGISYRTADNSQEIVVTIWKNGEWKRWGAMDAYYAQSDPDYLVTIPLKDIINYQEPPVDA